MVLEPGKSKNIIEVKAVKKTYFIGNQTVEALKDISLSIPQGTICAMTGRSGSGKSTLLHLIGTLDTPTSGTIQLLGQDVTAMNDRLVSKFRNQSIGFIFQMNNLLPEFSALENVMMPGLISGGVKQLVKDRGLKLLQAVGLEARADHRPGELSGGEQQRVAIARALLMEPPILLADEPTGNLDKKSSDTVMDLLMGLCHEQHITMLLVTHDSDLAKRLPQQIVLDDGKIADLGGQW